jgi:hypothetical protein
VDQDWNGLLKLLGPDDFSAQFGTLALPPLLGGPLSLLKDTGVELCRLVVLPAQASVDPAGVWLATPRSLAGQTPP